MIKIRVIDLFNKIANGEEVPKEIKYQGDIWLYDEQMQDYYYENEEVSEKIKYQDGIWLYDEQMNEENKDVFWLTNTFDYLNDEIEIIEEPKKIEIPKHIPNDVIQDIDRAICPANVKCIAHKVNELINYLQHISKGDSDE